LLKIIMYKYNIMTDNSHNIDHRFGHSGSINSMMEKCITAANEFAMINAKTCINILMDSAHYSSILKIHVSEKKLNEIGFTVNVNAQNYVGLWVKAASVTDAKQLLGQYRCGSFIQGKIDDAIILAKQQNKNYTTVKINLAELDITYPELKNVQKVLNVMIEFVVVDAVPYH